jgi:hypothetical protein
MRKIKVAESEINIGNDVRSCGKNLEVIGVDKYWRKVAGLIRAGYENKKMG